MLLRGSLVGFNDCYDNLLVELVHLSPATSLRELKSFLETFPDDLDGIYE